MHGKINECRPGSGEMLEMSIFYDAFCRKRQSGGNRSANGKSKKSMLRMPPSHIVREKWQNFVKNTILHI